MSTEKEQTPHRQRLAKLHASLRRLRKFILQEDQGTAVNLKADKPVKVVDNRGQTVSVVTSYTPPYVLVNKDGATSLKVGGGSMH